ncbi:MAG: hypothetical protein OXH50_15270 [Gemmatimonadetes bacterium]|nr:hypothetical protein [Gemmatimonadota bacterium]
MFSGQLPEAPRWATLATIVGFLFVESGFSLTSPLKKPIRINELQQPMDNAHAF